ncbi:hypothetical protein [Streptomyces hygroscopicus]|uniref:hypothetical protein n=1 Tax=Streptomyces hygroscopicus TaxID=1912 RepID=UPI000B1881C7|nr:hypothetical protein [Streptomyces hygroscopicus]
MTIPASSGIGYLCYDIGRKMGGSYTEYLRKRDKGGKKQKVGEALFHQHYREVQQFSVLFSAVNSEVIDKAGGRADILVSSGAMQFKIECKIEEDDASENALRQYITQPPNIRTPTLASPSCPLSVKPSTPKAPSTASRASGSNLFSVPANPKPCLVVIIRIPGGCENPNPMRTGPAS